MHNPKALKFNVSRKLSQLEKVVHLVQGQIAERLYQIEFLHSEYDPQTEQNLSVYATRMSSIQKEADEERDKLIQKVEKLYNRKLEVLTEEAQNYGRASTATLTQFQSKLTDEITELAKQTQQISESLMSRTTAVDSFVETAKQIIAAEIKRLNEKHRQAMHSHDEESAERLSALAEESRKRIADLEAASRRR
jgi:ABC-type transporter Mla subunit MlaD